MAQRLMKAERVRRGSEGGYLEEFIKRKREEMEKKERRDGDGGHFQEK